MPNAFLSPLAEQGEEALVAGMGQYLRSYHMEVSLNSLKVSVRSLEEGEERMKAIVKKMEEDEGTKEQKDGRIRGEEGEGLGVLLDWEVAAYDLRKEDPGDSWENLVHLETVGKTRD